MSTAQGRHYCEVVFYRSQGLGNRLFPWARCRVFSWMNNVPMLAPNWCLFRIGPLRRRQVRLRDFRRQSMLCGQFRPTADMITGLRRALVRHQATVVPEPERLSGFETERLQSGLHIVRFRGIDLAFGALDGWNVRIRAALLASMKRRERELAARTRGSVIGVHVRRGDFYPVSEAELASWEGPHGALRTPMSWFIRSIALVRQLLGRVAPAFVVSDGDPHEMRTLLDLEDVTLLRDGSPISDMIALSNAQVVIGSMESSFTAWASFLGQMTTCTFPAPAKAFPFVNQTGRYTGSLNPEAPSDRLVRDLRRLK